MKGQTGNVGRLIQTSDVAVHLSKWAFIAYLLLHQPDTLQYSR